MSEEQLQDSILLIYANKQVRVRARARVRVRAAALLHPAHLRQQAGPPAPDPDPNPDPNPYPNSILPVYANKQDMAEALSVQQIADTLELNQMQGRAWYIQVRYRHIHT